MTKLVTRQRGFYFELSFVLLRTIPANGNYQRKCVDNQSGRAQHQTDFFNAHDGLPVKLD